MTGVFSLATILLLLAGNTTSVFRALMLQNDCGFLFYAYGEMSLLFFCISALEKLPANSATHERKKEWLKFAVWVLSTSLSFTFCHRVSAVMPLALAAAVWAMALLVPAAGFFILFVYRDSSPDLDMEIFA